MDIPQLLAQTECLLRQNVEGYSQIPDDEKDLIRGFAVAWSMFEDKCCARNANCDNMKSIAANHSDKVPNFNALGDAYGYFAERYTHPENGSTRLHELCYKARRTMTCLKEIFETSAPPDESKLKAVLLVVYRLRNNLFHGNKNDNLSGQKDNFFHALTVINCCVANNFRA